VIEILSVVRKLKAGVPAGTIDNDAWMISVTNFPYVWKS
jgi:hypothetical protein